MDLLERSVPGLIIYALLWPLIFIPVNFHTLQPQISWGFTAGFCGLSILRYLQKLTTKPLYKSSSQRWLGIFATLSIGQAALWGILFALTLTDARMEPVKFLTGLAIAGMSAGAMSALAPRLWIAVTHIFFILIPGLFISAWINHDYSMTILLCTYFAYLLILGKRSNNEYHRAFKVEIQLEIQRQELERLNKIDPLTTIYNRGYFNTAFDVQWNLGVRQKQQQSLLIIDIDYFKSINDNHGHLIGDECLIHIAGLIHNTAKRKTDIIARFGGEEFAVMLSDTNLVDAGNMAESIRREIESNPFNYKQTTLSITVSIGVANITPTSEINSNKLIEMTDEALYKAKDSGRNCVRSFKPE